MKVQRKKLKLDHCSKNGQSNCVNNWKTPKLCNTLSKTKNKKIIRSMAPSQNQYKISRFLPYFVRWICFHLHWLVFAEPKCIINDGCRWINSPTQCSLRWIEMLCYYTITVATYLAANRNAGSHSTVSTTVWNSERFHRNINKKLEFSAKLDFRF